MRDGKICESGDDSFDFFLDGKERIIVKNVCAFDDV
jgi:hypothetical protein